MANNTVLNPGVGGDTLKTDDLGTSKVPVSKIMLGGAGLDLGYVTGSNPLPTLAMSGSAVGLLVGGSALNSINPVPVTLANSSNLIAQSGSVTGLLVGGVAAAFTNPIPVSGSVGLLIGGVQASLANPAPVTGSVGVLVAGSQASTANPLPTRPQSGSVTAILLGGNTTPVSFSNPFPVSGAMGLQVGGVAASAANPLPTISQSGSLIGLLVGGAALSNTNPLPVGSAWDQSGQMISGSILRTVQYSFGDFSSGSANQVVSPQGANGIVRLLAAHVMTPNAATLRWISTGSAGTITNISGLSPVPANGGYVLPFNPHGWCQTKANEGLNLALNTIGGTAGVTISWIIVGP